MAVMTIIPAKAIGIAKSDEAALVMRLAYAAAGRRPDPGGVG
jgi:hypothetical protein